jgi:hypothetical protein
VLRAKQNVFLGLSSSIFAIVNPGWFSENSLSKHSSFCTYKTTVQTKKTGEEFSDGEISDEVYRDESFGEDCSIKKLLHEEKNVANNL